MGSAGSHVSGDSGKRSSLDGDYEVEKAEIVKFLEKTKRCKRNCNCRKKHAERNVKPVQKLNDSGKKSALEKNYQDNKREISVDCGIKTEDKIEKEKRINQKYGKMFNIDVLSKEKEVKIPSSKIQVHPMQKNTIPMAQNHVITIPLNYDSTNTNSNSLIEREACDEKPCQMTQLLEKSSQTERQQGSSRSQSLPNLAFVGCEHSSY